MNIDDLKDIVFGLKGRVLTDKLYELAIAERAGGNIDLVAMARATEEAKGDEVKASAAYPKHRVRRIKDELKLQRLKNRELYAGSQEYEEQAPESFSGQENVIKSEKRKRLSKYVDAVSLVAIPIVVAGIVYLKFR